MSPELEARIAELEAKLLAKPESQRLRERILEAFCSEEDAPSDPRRLPHVVEYIDRFPHSSFARCPLAQYPPSAPSDTLAAVEAAWQSHVDDHRNDALIVRGLAGAVASRDRARAAEILETFVYETPDAEVWMDLGRVHPDPQARLASFLQARKLGSKQPNLLAWIAETASGLGDLEMVEQAGRELLALAEGARRTHDARVDWQDESLWQRALAEGMSEAEARRLIPQLTWYAQHTHWGHTALGFVAARRGDAKAAIEHLHASIRVRPDHRLTSYGPSFLLARALCEQACWTEVARYLQACEAFWNAERLRAYQREIAQQRVPDFK